MIPHLLLIGGLNYSDLSSSGLWGGWIGRQESCSIDFIWLIIKALVCNFQVRPQMQVPIEILFTFP